VSLVVGLVCPRCDTRYPIAPMHEGCPACADDAFRSGVTPEYDLDAVRASLSGGPLAEAGAGIWRFRRLLPLADEAHEVSLGEGRTALVTTPTLAEELDATAVWVKDESRNPTWSFKDRNAAVAVSMAAAFGARVVVASSSGNHGAAVAAYAARAGLGCVVVTYPGIPQVAADHIRAYGARLVITSRAGRWSLLREGVRERGWYPVTNLTEIPTNDAYGHEGYKAIAYELFDELRGELPDYVVVPTGYAEGLFGIWKGFDELVSLGLAARVPRLIACEPVGGPLGEARRLGVPIARVEPRPTIARGIGAAVSSYIGNVAIERSGGIVAQADDTAIRRAQADLASAGIYLEPAAATALAGVRELARLRVLPRGARIVLIGTSAGLRNPASVASELPAEIAPTLEAFDAGFSAVA
jgi:threonine synthase